MRRKVIRCDNCRDADYPCDACLHRRQKMDRQNARNREFGATMRSLGLRRVVDCVSGSVYWE